MAYVLRVPFRRQLSPASCWWAAASMMIEYFEGRRLPFPWDFDPVFEVPERTHASGPVVHAYGALPLRNLPLRLLIQCTGGYGELVEVVDAFRRGPRVPVLLNNSRWN